MINRTKLLVFGLQAYIALSVSYIIFRFFSKNFQLLIHQRGYLALIVISLLMLILLAYGANMIKKEKKRGYFFALLSMFFLGGVPSFYNMWVFPFFSGILFMALAGSLIGNILADTSLRKTIIKTLVMESVAFGWVLSLSVHPVISLVSEEWESVAELFIFLPLSVVCFYVAEFYANSRNGRQAALLFFSGAFFWLLLFGSILALTLTSGYIFNLNI